MKTKKCGSGAATVATLVLLAAMFATPTTATAEKIWSVWFYPDSVQIVSSAGFTVSPFNASVAGACAGNRFRAYVGQEGLTQTTIGWYIDAVSRAVQMLQEVLVWGYTVRPNFRVYYETNGGYCYARFVEMRAP